MASLVSCARAGCPGRRRQVVAFCAAIAGAGAGRRMRRGRPGSGSRAPLGAVGVGCVVAAPGKIERPAQDRVKTDRRDAERLVRLLMIGALHAVRVPSGEEEALRDLVERVRISAAI